MDDRKTVADCFPREAFMDWPALDVLRRRRVIAEYTERRWPGRQKNVAYWIAIEGGKAIGWNENPAKGWTFSIINFQSEDNR